MTEIVIGAATYKLDATTMNAPGCGEPGGNIRNVCVTAAYLAAADGLHSAARKHLYPAEGEPIYGGRIL